MKAYVEFRIPETYAKEFLPPKLGKNLRDFVRRVRVPGNSETYERIGEIYKFIRLRDQDYFFRADVFGNFNGHEGSCRLEKRIQSRKYRTHSWII